VKTIDDFAREASAQIGRWYGWFEPGARSYAPPKRPPPSCTDFLKAHWARFPATDPTGGQIIDGEATEIHGFIESKQ
jgi:hypothetical protein